LESASDQLTVIGYQQNQTFFFFVLSSFRAFVMGFEKFSLRRTTDNERPERREQQVPRERNDLSLVTRN
jgi:hypothetical protein